LHVGDASLPWFVPAMTISLVVAIASGGAVGRAQGVGPAVGFLLIVSFGLIVSSTLTPQREALEYGIRGSGSCSFSRFWPASLHQYLFPSETPGNVLMFIPLGAAIGWLPPSRGKLALLALAIALPFAVETTQMLLPVLDRACESADVVDNLLGLAIGLVLGSAAGLVVRRGQRERSG
jgi:hypothetical protein